MSEPRSEHAYIGTAPCGCTFAISVAPTTPARRGDVARTVAQWINDGATVEYLPLGEAHERFAGMCGHEPRWAGMSNGGGLFASEADAYKLAADVVRRDMLDDCGPLVPALDRLVPGAPEGWWMDLEERCEQYLTDMLWTMSPPASAEVRQ